jgi:hypothetical protein
MVPCMVVNVVSTNVVCLIQHFPGTLKFIMNYVMQLMFLLVHVVSVEIYSQTSPCRHLYKTVFCIKGSPFAWPVRKFHIN